MFGDVDYVSVSLYLGAVVILVINFKTQLFWIYLYKWKKISKLYINYMSWFICESILKQNKTIISFNNRYVEHQMIHYKCLITQEHLSVRQVLFPFP